jgi:hypothetical protein
MIGFRIPWLLLAACLLSSFAAARSDARARTVRSWLARSVEADGLGQSDARYAVAYVDLDRDGVNEALAYLQGPSACGSGGCRLYVLARRAGYWRLVSEHTVTNRPIRVLATRHHGWRDLSVWVAGGGILKGHHAALAFDGRAYPLNPTVPPARRVPGSSQGRILIAVDTPLIPLRR